MPHLFYLKLITVTVKQSAVGLIHDCFRLNHQPLRCYCFLAAISAAVHSTLTDYILLGL